MEPRIGVGWGMWREGLCLLEDWGEKGMVREKEQKVKYQEASLQSSSIANSF